MRIGKWGAVVTAGLFAGTSFGAGYQLYTEGSAEVLGQAGAISGRTNLTSLAWYNPSALAGTERPQIMVGSAFVSIDTDYKSGIDPAFDASMSDEWRAIPHLYYVLPLEDNLTTMISINAPYGLITEWPDSWGPPHPTLPGNPPAGSLLATYSELRSIYITPSIAYRVADRFAISAGVNVVDAEAELQRTGVTLKGDDMSYGGTVSAHYQALDDWAIGARYQSKVKLEFEGAINAALPAGADLTLPSSVNIGIANTSIDNLSLGLDLVWTEWSTYDQLVVVAPPAPTEVVPKNWDDVWSVRVGGEYALGESWALRAGYVWDESPVPNTTRAPELPGADRQMVMAGIGWKGENLGIDLAYSYLWADKVDMGTIYAPLVGEFETTTHLLALSVGYEF